MQLSLVSIGSIVRIEPDVVYFIQRKKGAKR